VSETPSTLADGVTTRLGELGAAMRLQGARVGVDELLGAHRALAAMAGGGREDSRLALRAVLCSRREDFPRFEVAFLSVFGDAYDPGAGSSLDELGSIARAALPRAGIEDPAPPSAGAQSRDEPDPYSFPAMMMSGTPSEMYFSEASKIDISAPSGR